MKTSTDAATQALIFSVVAAGFTTIYITQPVLPVIRDEFGVDVKTASLTVSMVILGIALANLPFGMLADRSRIKPIILAGGTVVSAANLFCAVTDSIVGLILARFVQGLFIPSLTTCIAAYLARTLPIARLNVAMGSYVAATVAGGLGGRLLGGWIHPPLHWRYAFVSAAGLLILASIAALIWLPEEKANVQEPQKAGFSDLLVQPGLVRMLVVGFGGFFVFSSTFNYLPFYLSSPPFSAPTEVITLVYLAYLVGLVTGPLSGRISNQIGSGATMIGGSLVLIAAVAATLIQSLAVIAISLVALCAGFFSVHSAAVGLLNRRLITSRGRANSLYVLAYYAGGAVGITACGYTYNRFAWSGVVALSLTVLLLPLAIGLVEILQERKQRRWIKSFT
jgi:MFS transporter, YNFM family, putative membrane transport protein